MTWDRTMVKKLYSGAEHEEERDRSSPGWFVDPVRGHSYFRWSGLEDTPAGLLLNLTSTGSDGDPAAVLEPLLRTLNEQVDPQEDEEAEEDGWGDGWLEVATPGLEAIAIQNRGDFLTPTYYLDELCRVLTARGWVGHVTVPPLAHSMMHGGDEPSIVTVLGYGVSEVPREERSHPDRQMFRPSWTGDTELSRHVAEIAVDWLEGAPGDIVVDGSMEWVATVDQSRAHLAWALVRGMTPTVERLVAGERPPDRAATRTGRAAYARGGSLVLLEHEPTRSLEDRLADHRQARARPDHRISYAMTTGTHGFARNEPAVAYGQRDDLRYLLDGLRRSTVVPVRLKGHGQGCPDVHYAQVLPTEWLPFASDLSDWEVHVREHGLTEVVARDPAPWFVVREAMDPTRRVHDVTDVVRRQARAAFGDLLQKPVSD